MSGILAGGRAVGAWLGWREWRVRRAADPSAAELYLASARVDATVALLALAVALLVWWLLRPASRPGGGPGA